MKKEYFKSLMPIIKDIGLISIIWLIVFAAIIYCATAIDWFVYYEPLNIKENFDAFIMYVVMIVGVFILFLPAEIISIYICKK